jgi:hypothetical protein
MRARLTCRPVNLNSALGRIRIRVEAGIGRKGENAVKRLLVLVATATVALTVAGLAGASTTVTWRATFPETFGGPINSPFSCAPGTSCGSGEVTGLGQAQDVIVFNGCGGGCDVRTLTFADGSTIVMHETGSNPQEFNSNPNSYGNPFRLDLSDTIVGGTGRFKGATGTATGEVRVQGGVALITLSGTVTF